VKITNVLAPDIVWPQGVQQELLIEGSNCIFVRSEKRSPRIDHPRMNEGLKAEVYRVGNVFQSGPSICPVGEDFGGPPYILSSVVNLIKIRV